MAEQWTAGIVEGDHTWMAGPSRFSLPDLPDLPDQANVPDTAQHQEQQRLTAEQVMPRLDVGEVNQEARQSYFLVGRMHVPIQSSTQDIRNGNSDHNTNDFSVVDSAGEVNMEARPHPITSTTTYFLEEMQQLPDQLPITERVAKSEAQLGVLKESERGSSRISQSTVEGRCTSSGKIKQWGEGCSRQPLGRGVNIQRSVKNRYHPLREDSEIEEQEEEHPEEENTEVLLAAAREAAKRPKKVQKRLRQKQKHQQRSSLGAPTLLLVCFFLLLATLYSTPQP